MEIPVFSSRVSRDCAVTSELARHWHSSHDATPLEYHSRVPEYEIYGPGYVTLPVELSKGMDIQCVLVTIDRAPVQSGQVRIYPQGNRLMFLWTSSVLDCDVPGQKAIARHR